MAHKHKLRFNRKSFVYRGVLLALSNLVLQTFAFVYRILLSTLAGPEGIGTYTLVMQVYTIVTSVCMSGVSLAVITVSARLYATGSITGVRKLVRLAMAAFVVLFVLGALPVLLFRQTIAENLLGDVRIAPALIATLCCIFLTGFENILKAVFQGCQKVRFSAASELGEIVVRFAAVLFLFRRVAVNDYNAAFLIMAGMTVSEVFSVVFLTISYAKNFMKKTGPPARDIGKSFARVAVPSAVTSIVGNLFSAVTTMLLPLRLMAAGFSRYGAVACLGVVSGMISPLILLPMAFISSLCTLLLPSVSACAATGDIAGLRRKINMGMRSAGLVALPFTALLLPLIPTLCTLLFNQAVSPWLALLLAVDAIISYYQIVCANVLNGISQQKYVLMYTAVCESMQLVLAWFLSAAPALNIYGYIISMIAGAALRLVLMLRRIRAVTGARPDPSAYLLTPLVCSAVVWACSISFFPVFTGLTGSVIAGIACVTGLCAAMYFVVTQLLGLRIFGYLFSVLLVGKGKRRAA